MTVRQLMGRRSLHAADLPPTFIVALKLETQHRCRKQIEQMQRQSIITTREVATEVDAQRELAGLQRIQILLNQFIQFIRQDSHAGAILKVLQRDHARQRLVAPRRIPAT